MRWHKSVPLSIPRSAGLRWRKSALSPLDTSAPRRPLSSTRLSIWLMIFPNQTEFGLEFSGHWQFSSKPNWIWFGKGHWIKCSCSALPILQFFKNIFTFAYDQYRGGWPPLRSAWLWNDRFYEYQMAKREGQWPIGATNSAASVLLWAFWWYKYLQKSQCLERQGQSTIWMLEMTRWGRWIWPQMSIFGTTWPKRGIRNA